MNQVFGSVNLTVSIPVENTNETLALMEANFRLNPDRIIKYELVAIDCHGERIVVDVHDGNADLNEFIEA